MREDRTEWTRLAAMTEQEIEDAIAADHDGFAMTKEDHAKLAPAIEQRRRERAKAIASN